MWSAALLIACSSLAAQPPPPLAKTPGDVARTTLTSYASLGGLGFSFTAVSETLARRNVGGMARSRVPYFVVQSALKAGNKWGKLSAGFAGGRALGQVIRGADDRIASSMAAICGGIASANSVAEIPTSVGTFLAFTYFIDTMSGGSASGGANSSPRARAAQQQKIEKQIAATQRHLDGLEKKRAELERLS
jgi:hypothetical protein